MVSRGGGRASARGNRNIHESAIGSAHSGAIPSQGSNSVDQFVDSFQRARGSNVLDQITIHPSTRKMICLNTAGQFEDASVIRSILSTLKTMFNGPWTIWKDVDAINSEALWQHFKGLYQWDPYKYTDEVIHDAWTEVMKICFSDIMTNARKESVKLAKAKNVNASGDMSLLKSFNPKWIRSEYWEKMIDEVWNKDK
ncbi:unnamed protein product [Lactuca virosa]|uniref:Uncharacterized protein n=1 Tax=Lactuca virosa TaxID=75947 RepID=A0AAU9LV40_9ASTR|nr:unnamed protein product [Lactuca virosa]